MNKITFLLTTIIFAGTITVAEADNYKYVPYAGADYVFSDISIKNFSPNMHAVNLRIGSEYSPYFGTELFFAQSNTDKHVDNGDISTKQSYRAYGLDIAGYLPLDCHKKFSLIATGGIGEYIFKIKVSPQKHQNEHGYGYRFGGGLKYALTPNWQTRLMARYIKFDHLSKYEHATEYTAGIEYHFN